MENIYCVTLREISGKDKEYETTPVCFRRYPSYKDIKISYEQLNGKVLPIHLNDMKGKSTPAELDLIVGDNVHFEVRIVKSILN